MKEKKQSLKSKVTYVKKNWMLYIFFLMPALLLTIIFKYVPMGGLLIAFKDYNVIKDMNLPASEILSTYVYRIGLLNGDYGYSTAVGLFNSVINVILLIIVNAVVKKLNDGEGI